MGGFDTEKQECHTFGGLFGVSDENPFREG